MGSRELLLGFRELFWSTCERLMGTRELLLGSRELFWSSAIPNSECSIQHR